MKVGGLLTLPLFLRERRICVGICFFVLFFQLALNIYFLTVPRCVYDEIDQNQTEKERHEAILLGKYKDEICILMFDDGRSKMQGRLREMSVMNKEEYAELHGYRFIYETQSKISNDERAPPWHKVLYTYRSLFIFGCSAVLFMDTDTFITNRTLRIESILKDYQDKDMVVAKDPWAHINSGVWWVKRSDPSLSILTRLWKADDVNQEQWKLTWGYEQSVLLDMINKNY